MSKQPLPAGILSVSRSDTFSETGTYIVVFEDGSQLAVYRDVFQFSTPRWYACDCAGGDDRVVGLTRAEALDVLAAEYAAKKAEAAAKKAAREAALPRCEKCRDAQAMHSPVVLVRDDDGGRLRNEEVLLCAACSDGMFRENEYGDEEPEYVGGRLFRGVAGSLGYPVEEVGYTYPAAGSTVGRGEKEDEAAPSSGREALLAARSAAEREAAVARLAAERGEPRAAVIRDLLQAVACLDCSVCRGVSGCVCWTSVDGPFDGATNAGLPTPREALPLLARDETWRSPWALSPEPDWAGNPVFYRRAVGRAYHALAQEGAWVCYVSDRVEYTDTHRGHLRLTGCPTADWLRRSPGGAFRASRTATAAEVARLGNLSRHPSCFGAEYVLLADLREVA